MTAEQQKELEKVKEVIQDKIESNIKEAKDWLGSWDELRALIDQLEENEAEAAFERHSNDY